MKPHHQLFLNYLDPVENNHVSFTSWFGGMENGERLSSNKVIAEVFMGTLNQAHVEKDPNILDVHEIAVIMAIIKLII